MVRREELHLGGVERCHYDESTSHKVLKKTSEIIEERETSATPPKSFAINK